MLDPPGCAADVWQQINGLVGRSSLGNFYSIRAAGSSSLEHNGVLTHAGRRHEANTKLTD